MINPILALLLALGAVPAGSRSLEHHAPVAGSPIVPALTGYAAVDKPKVPLPRWRLIRWLQEFTPGGGGAGGGPPGGPPGRPPGGGWEDRVYLSFVRGNCRETLYLARLTGNHAPLTEPRRSLYEGAAAACLAAFNRRTELWPIAGSRLDRVRRTALDCQDRAVLRILREIVDTHRADPTVRFVRVDPLPGGSCRPCAGSLGPPCRLPIE